MKNRNYFTYNFWLLDYFVCVSAVSLFASTFVGVDSETGTRDYFLVAKTILEAVASYGLSAFYFLKFKSKNSHSISWVWISILGSIIFSFIPLLGFMLQAADKLSTEINLLLSIFGSCLVLTGATIGITIVLVLIFRSLVMLFNHLKGLC